MDFDELKNKWKDIDGAPCPPHVDERDLAMRLAASRVTTSKDKLQRHLFLTVRVGVLMALFILIIDMGLPAWLTVTYSAYGLLMAALSYATWRRIRNHDFISMPVSESLRCVIALRRQMALVRAVGITVGALVLASLGAVLLSEGDRYVAIGFFAGLAIGLPIGIWRVISVRRITRSLEDDLRACEG